MKKQLEQLVESFKSAGLTLSDDQQKELNTFVESFEAKITEAKEEGKATAKDISIKLTETAISEYDAEMKEATEKLIEAIDAKHAAELDVKVSEAIKAEKDTLVEKVDDYLKLYIKELIPESLLVDYDKMQRQCKAIETIKETLLITDDVVQAKAKEISESITAELVESKEKLNATIEKNMKLNKVIEVKMADEILESKLVDLPELESSKLRKYFESASKEEIEEQFETVYETIKTQLDENTDEDKSSKIKEIIETNIIDEDINKDKKIEEKLNKIDPIMESYVARLKTTQSY